MKIADAIHKARALNIGMTVTEHLDLAYPEPDAFIFDIDEYFKSYDRFRSDTVLLGIEVGMRSELVAENQAKLLGQPFDYIIGSIHVVEGIDIYQETFYHGRTKREVYEKYFESMVRCVESYDFIDSLGHIDYIVRYARFSDPELYIDEFKDYLDRIFQLLIQKQKALEINTRRLADRKTMENLLTIYNRYWELGGRWVTIGSDAHTPGDIAKHFAAAFEIADRCNLRPVYYKNRDVHYVER
jgi:histidinol-phosphatase (PHP family)